MARKLKIFGGLSMSRNGQTRTIIAATSQRAAVDLLNDQMRQWMSLNEFRKYWCETENEAEVAAALSKPNTIMVEIVPRSKQFKPLDDIR